MRILALNWKTSKPRTMYLINKAIYISGLFFSCLVALPLTLRAQDSLVFDPIETEYIDYLPKYQQVSQSFIISKIAYTPQEIILFFHCVVNKDNDTLRFYGQDRSLVWYLSNQSRAESSTSSDYKQSAQVYNIRLNDELIRAKLNKRSNTDLAGQRGDIISCEIHFKKNKTPLRSLHLLGGDCFLADPTKARFNCLGILMKSKESGLLSNPKQMLSNFDRFYSQSDYVKYPDIKESTTLAQQATLDKKAIGQKVEMNKDPFEKHLQPINYMPHMLIGQEDFKCNERVIMTDVHFHEKRPDFISRSKALASLNLLIDYLKVYEDSKVAIHAHTDIHGNAFSNLEISNKHAQAVKKVLLSKGIDTNRIIAIHHGGAQTLLRYKNGSAMNRRVEVEILCNETASKR